jgi:hypothetical protein
MQGRLESGRMPCKVMNARLRPGAGVCPPSRATQGTDQRHPTCPWKPQSRSSRRSPALPVHACCSSATSPLRVAASAAKEASRSPAGDGSSWAIAQLRDDDGRSAMHCRFQIRAVSRMRDCWLAPTRCRCCRRSEFSLLLLAPMRASGRCTKDCCVRMSRCLPTCRVWLARLLAVGDRERRSCSPEIRA